MVKNTPKKSLKSRKKKTETPSVDELVDKIKTSVVSELKEQLNNKIENLREDLYNDFKENFTSPPSLPPPSVASSPDILGSVQDALKGGNIDLQKIGGLLGGARPPLPTGPDGKPIDMKDLTEGQIEFMKMQQNQSMLTSLLPLILGGQSGGGFNEVFKEIMMRSFQSKLAFSEMMEKTMVQAMTKKFGVPDAPSSVDPIIAAMTPKPKIEGVQNQSAV